MARAAADEATLSIRFLWSFARLISAETNGLLLLSELGVGPEQFGDPDARLSRAAVMRALERAVEVTGNALLGLDAGQQMDHGDFDALEYAARSRPSLGEAIGVMTRYQRIMMDAVDASLMVEGGRAYWRWRPSDGFRLPAPGNDYVIATALSFSRRNAAVYTPPLEVRLMHARTPYAEAYERAFDCAVTFDAPYNTVVMQRARLEVPMIRANPAVSAAFQIQVDRTVAKLRVRDGIVGRVRECLMDDLRDGSASMQQTARRLAMGTATLRRRLEDEGTTFSEIVDDLRRELAERHLNEPSPTVSEIAFLLGFSDVRAFAKAFRRWTGQAPTEYRAERRG
jgi:AraC-like DNA-binding protein